MQPMIRASRSPSRPALPARAPRRFTAVKALVGLTFGLGALGLVAGALTFALLACVTATILLVADGLAAQTRLLQERLEVLARELSAARSQLTQLARHGAGTEENDELTKTLVADGRFAAGLEPQPAGHESSLRVRAP